MRTSVLIAFGVLAVVCFLAAANDAKHHEVLLRSGADVSRRNRCRRIDSSPSKPKRISFLNQTEMRFTDLLVCRQNNLKSFILYKKPAAKDKTFLAGSRITQEIFCILQARTRQLISALAEIVQHDAERGVDKDGCRHLWGGCKIDDDCCPRLGCIRKYGHCGWDGTFSD